MKKTHVKKSIQGKRLLSIVFLAVCTVISGFGICTAPPSDEKKLEKELKQNEEFLKQIALASPKKQERNAGDPQTAEFVSVIGDSVFLGAAPEFQKLEPDAVINAKVSRQVRHGLDVAKKMKKKGTLGNTVILSLGTNGNFNPATGEALLEFLGNDRQIYWINVHGKNISWQKKVNQTIQDLAKKHENVHVINWTKKAKKHSGWFYQDGTHLNASGQKKFASFIQKKIR